MIILLVCNAPVNVTPQGGEGGQTPGILTEQNIAVRNPHWGQKFHVRIPGVKNFFSTISIQIVRLRKISHQMPPNYLLGRARDTDSHTS